jgi:3-dehydroquinate synthase
MPPDETKLTVALGARSYPIHVGRAIIDRAGELLAPYLPQAGRAPVFIVTDQTVGPLYARKLQAALSYPNVAVIELPSGEAHKNLRTLETLLAWLIDKGVERGSLILALGGGIVGDVAGFAASVILRGISYVQIPTTLLAQVDSSVGGKTGIDMAGAKNLVGSFHQPRAVLIDLGTLKSLDERQMRAGYAEIVKYGLIDEPEFFAWLEENGRRVLAKEEAALTRAIVTSCRAKARIVADDEKEAGARALLNLGHTFGHALESLSGFGAALLHGEAVAIGLVCAFRLSVRLGFCPPEDCARLCAHLARMGLPLAPLQSFAPHELFAAMRRDKKVQEGDIAFVLARGIGQAFTGARVPEAEVIAFLQERELQSS